MLLTSNETDIDIDVFLLEKITNSLTKKDVECIFVKDITMQKLNLEARNIDKSTDVLSFPLSEVPHAPLGSIVINIEFAKKAADEFGHTLSDEISLLFIHGMLHLLGFDHEADDGEMRQKEALLIKEFNLPESLIDRTLK